MPEVLGSSPVKLPQVYYLLQLRVLSDYRKELGSGQMGKLLVLTSGRIVVTLIMMMKTVPTSCYQVSGFTRIFCPVHDIKNRILQASNSRI